MFSPAVFKVFRQFRREPGVVKLDSRTGTLACQLKSGNRINPFRPIYNAPRLHDQAVGGKFKLSSNDMAAKD